jgi:Iap family predicted aminopeptidase
MTLLSFIENQDVYGETDATHWFELHVGHAPTNIFYPTPELHAYAMQEVKTVYGLDAETEAWTSVYNQLIEKYDALAFDSGRTKLELLLALDLIQAKLRTKYFNLHQSQKTDLIYRAK